MIKYNIKPRVSWQRPRRQIWPRTGVQEPAGAGQYNHDADNDGGGGDGDGSDFA